MVFSSLGGTSGISLFASRKLPVGYPDKSIVKGSRVSVTDTELSGGRVVDFDQDRRLAYVIFACHEGWWAIRDLKLEK